MKKKMLLALLCIVCTLCCAFGMIACGVTHEHTYSAKWSSDEDFHWHAATCEHTSEVKDRAPHEMVDGVCTVCGYVSEEDDGTEKVYRTVTFNLNGGDGKIEAMQFVVGKVMADLPVPQRSGYTFICWQEAYGSEFTAASVMPDRNLTLVAKWEKKLTSYSDQYVSFKPATEGYKSSLVYMQYYGEVDQFVYVEITSDDLGGPDEVGESNNFTLRTMDSMEYKVNSGYTWAWYQGSFDVPNGAQRFSLNYGSNIQFVTISDGDGVVRQTYLVDLYVLHDYYINLYNNIYETKPYDTVRIVENERFSEFYETPESKFEADARVYFNSKTGKYENFVYSTAITKDWDLYQTYKPYAIATDLDGGEFAKELEEPFAITPYTVGYTLPVPVKAGYDFIGWKNSSGFFVTDANGSGGIKYYAENSDKTKPASITIADKLTAVFEESNMYYDSDSNGVSSFKAVRNFTYTDNYKTVISKTTFSVESGHKVTTNTQRVAVGSEVTVTASKLGHTFVGWYDGETKLSDKSEYTFVMPAENITYTTDYTVNEELEIFEFTATEDKLVITGIKDSTVTELVVPDYATAINNGALKNCNSLTSLTIPFVGYTADETEYTFFNWIFGGSLYWENWYKIPASLKTVIITSATSIGNNAFCDCRNITTIVIPESLTSISAYAFSGCYKLAEVYNLSSLDISAGSEGNGSIAYYAKSVYTSLDEQSKVTTTDDGYTFYADGDDVYLISYNGNATELTLPSDFNGKSYEIDHHAFYSRIADSKVEYICPVEKLVIPEGVTAIGNNAFNYCRNLTDVTISDSVTYIANGAFSDCIFIENITVPFIGETKDGTENALFGSLFGATSYDGIINYVYESIKTVTITGGTTIPENAFRGCQYITSITLPENLTSIGERAFYSCYGLTGIELPEELQTIGTGAFEGCTNLTEIVVPDSVTNIGSRAFAGCNVESITLPFVGESAESKNPLGYVFGTFGYTGVPAIMIKQNNITYYFPQSLKEVNITGGNILKNAFYNCLILTSITLPEDITSIGEYAFYNCTALEYIEIPESVTTIGEYAFYGCSSINNIVLPEGLLSIDSYAFNNCRSLQSINIPKGITRINNQFVGCGFTNLVIPDTVTSISAGAFNGCNQLVSLTIPFVGGAANTVDGPYQYPFGYIFGSSSYVGGVGVVQYYYGSSTSDTASGHYYIPSSLKNVTVTGGDILYGAFYYCKMLESITLPEGITTISKEAFYECSSLVSIVIPSSVQSISSSAIPNNSGLNLYYGGTVEDWNNTIGLNYSKVQLYCYSETEPEEEGNYWHYDTDGVTPVVW